MIVERILFILQFSASFDVYMHACTHVDLCRQKRNGVNDFFYIDLVNLTRFLSTTIDFFLRGGVGGVGGVGEFGIALLDLGAVGEASTSSSTSLLCAITLLLLAAAAADVGTSAYL